MGGDHFVMHRNTSTVGRLNFKNKLREKESRFTVTRGVGQTDEGSQKAQISSYMINKS